MTAHVSPGPAAGQPGPGEVKPPRIWPYVTALVALATAGPAALVLSLVTA